MTVADLADLTANLAVGFSVLVVGAIILIGLRHTMKSCECCGPPEDFEPDDDIEDDCEGEDHPDDPDRWRDYDLADDAGVL